MEAFSAAILNGIGWLLSLLVLPFAALFRGHIAFNHSPGSTPSSLWDLIESRERARNEGTVAWNPPAKTKVGKRERIEVRVADLSVTVEEVRRTMKAEGAIIQDSLPVTALMVVELQAPSGSFNIQSLNSPEQWVQTGNVTGWDFFITAKKSGEFPLRLVVKARIKIGDKEGTRDFPAYEQTVSVKSAPAEAARNFFRKHWLKFVIGVITLVVLPATAAVLGKTGLADSVARWFEGAAGIPSRPVEAKNSAAEAPKSDARSGKPAPR